MTYDDHVQCDEEIAELKAEVERLKDLLRYAYELPMEAGNFDENNKWLIKVEQALKDPIILPEEPK